MKKIVVGITAPLSVILIKGQLKYFVERGYDVYLLAPDVDVVRDFCKEEGCKHLGVDIEREINPINDLISLFVIIKHLIKVRPDVVNVGTPKMGLLGMLAAFIVGSKRRIFTCRGFRYEHEVGIKKKILMSLDRLVSTLAHQVICISPSVKDRGIQDHIFSLDKALLIGAGSSNGVDLKSFDPNNIDIKRKKELISSLQLNNKFVFGFVGRIVDRKGVKELYNAFEKLYSENSNLHLVIVGKTNIEQVSDVNLLQKLETHPAITLTGYTNEVPTFMSLFDIFVLPAWWEGFGNTLIQAAAMGIPVISTTGTGCRDAVNNGFNGTLVPPKDTDSLYKYMKQYLLDKDLRERHGKNGIEWAKQFNSEFIWMSLEEIYKGNVSAFYKKNI